MRLLCSQVYTPWALVSIGQEGNHELLNIPSTIAATMLFQPRSGCFLYQDFQVARPFLGRGGARLRLRLNCTRIPGRMGQALLGSFIGLLPGEELQDTDLLQGRLLLSRKSQYLLLLAGGKLTIPP